MTICICGKEITKRERETLKEVNNRKFCSQKCYNISRRSSSLILSRMIDLYEKEKLSLSEIGRMFGVSHGVVKKKLQYSGVHIRRTRITKKEQEIIRVQKSGWKNALKFHG